MKIFKFYLLVIVLSGTMTNLFGQDSTATSKIASVVYLDSFTVFAEPIKLNIDDFISKVVNDTTFYKAFQRLRYTDHFSQSSFVHQTKSNTFYSNKTHQKVIDSLRTFSIIEESSNKFFKRSGKHKHYTSKMFDRIFYKRDTTILKQPGKTVSPTSKIEKYKNDLKLLIFKPGTKIDIPFLSKKSQIFSDEMIPLYNYTFYKIVIKEKERYVFEVSSKDLKSDKTAIKRLKTYFDADNFDILGRELHLKQRNLMYKFDVFFNIDLTKVNGFYLPSKIIYDGKWKVPLKRHEDFKIDLNFNF